MASERSHLSEYEAMKLAKAARGVVKNEDMGRPTETFVSSILSYIKRHGAMTVLQHAALLNVLDGHPRVVGQCHEQSARTVERARKEGLFRQPSGPRRFGALDHAEIDAAHGACDDCGSSLGECECGAIRMNIRGRRKQFKHEIPMRRLVDSPEVMETVREVASFRPHLLAPFDLNCPLCPSDFDSQHHRLMGLVPVKYPKEFIELVVARYRKRLEAGEVPEIPIPEDGFNHAQFSGLRRHVPEGFTFGIEGPTTYDLERFLHPVVREREPLVGGPQFVTVRTTARAASRCWSSGSSTLPPGGTSWPEPSGRARLDP